MLPFSSFSEETSDVMCLEGGWLICRSVCRLPPPTPPQSHVRNPTEETGGYSYWQTDPSILRVLSYFEQMSDKGSAYSWTEKLFWRDIQYFCNWRALAEISSVPKKRGTNICTSRKLIRSVLCHPGSPGGQIKRDKYTRCSFLMVFPKKYKARKS